MKQTEVLGDRTNPITRKLLEQAGRDKVIKKVIEGKEEEQEPLSLEELFKKIMERPKTEPYTSGKSCSPYEGSLSYDFNYNTPMDYKSIRVLEEYKKTYQSNLKEIETTPTIPKPVPAGPSALERKVAGALKTPALDSSGSMPDVPQEESKKPGFLRRVFGKKLGPVLAGLVLGSCLYFGRHNLQNGNQYYAMGPKE